MIHALGDLPSVKSPKVMSQQNINLYSEHCGHRDNAQNFQNRFIFPAARRKNIQRFGSSDIKYLSEEHTLTQS